MIQLGMYVAKSDGLSFQERIEIIRNAGFDFICIGMEPLATPEDAAALLNFCANKGIAIENVHLTGNGTHTVWAEGPAGDGVIDRYCREIALCSDYGIKTGIVHVTWGIDPPPVPCALGLKRFERVAECAEKHNFTVALENSVSAEHLRYTLAALDSPAIGYCFDSGHRNAFAPEADYLGAYGHRLAALHLQDNDGKDDLHLIPLDGCINWDEIIVALARTTHGRMKITAEAGGIVRRQLPGKSAQDIRRSLERVKILDDETLVDIQDGGFTVYAKLSYEARIHRVYRAMKTIAAGVQGIHI